MSRDLIYQFLFGVALSHFVFSSSYMQLSCRVLLKRSGIIQSLDFSAISLCCTLRYITLRYVTLRYVTLQDWLFTAIKHYGTSATSGFRCLAVSKSLSENVQELCQKMLLNEH